MAEKSEGLILGLECDGNNERWEFLKKKWVDAANSGWQPELGDFLLLSLYQDLYQRKLEQFIDLLDVSKCEDVILKPDPFDRRKSRTYKEKLIEIKTLIEEMQQRRKSNDVIAFVSENGVT